MVATHPWTEICHYTDSVRGTNRRWRKGDRINPIDMDRVNRFGGRLSLVPSAGHMPQVEKPPRIEAVLRGFYATLGFG